MTPGARIMINTEEVLSLFSPFYHYLTTFYDIHIFFCHKVLQSTWKKITVSLTVECSSATSQEASFRIKDKVVGMWGGGGNISWYYAKKLKNNSVFYDTTEILILF